MKDYLDRVVKCPKCNRDVIYRNMIWLEGECLCPNCYISKRAKLDSEIKRRK